MAKYLTAFLLALTVAAASAGAWDFNAGFSAGSVGGSAAWQGVIAPGFAPGAWLSTDFFPGGRAFSLGPEAGLVYAPLSGTGAAANASALMFPFALRLAWHLSFIKAANLDLFLLGRAGVAPGIWLDAPPNTENPLGFVYGVTIGAKFFVTPALGAFIEAGYNHYGFSAANSRDTAAAALETTLAAYAALGLCFRFSDSARPLRKAASDPWPALRSAAHTPGGLP